MTDDSTGEVWTLWCYFHAVDSDGDPINEVWEFGAEPEISQGDYGLHITGEKPESGNPLRISLDPHALRCLTLEKDDPEE